MKKYRLAFLITLLLFPAASWIITFFFMVFNRQFIKQVYFFIGIILTLCFLICLILFTHALKKLSAEFSLAREIKLLEQNTKINELQRKELESLTRDANERQQIFVRHLTELPEINTPLLGHLTECEINHLAAKLFGYKLTYSSISATTLT